MFSTGIVKRAGRIAFPRSKNKMLVPNNAQTHSLVKMLIGPKVKALISIGLVY